MLLREECALFKKKNNNMKMCCALYKNRNLVKSFVQSYYRGCVLQNNCGECKHPPGVTIAAYKQNFAGFEVKPLDDEAQ